jgi:type I restriction enzyme S subunit
MPKITGDTLRSLPIQLPATVDERREVVHEIESAFQWVDRVAAETAHARRLIDHLDQAVLAKAFQGELVPQNPSDEPASVLLERIRTERGAAVPVGRVSKGASRDTSARQRIGHRKQ